MSSSSSSFLTSTRAVEDDDDTGLGKEDAMRFIAVAVVVKLCCCRRNRTLSSSRQNNSLRLSLQYDKYISTISCSRHNFSCDDNDVWVNRRPLTLGEQRSRGREIISITKYYFHPPPLLFFLLSLLLLGVMMMLIMLLLMVPTAADGFSTNHYWNCFISSQKQLQQHRPHNMERLGRGGDAKEGISNRRHGSRCTVSEMEAESNILREQIKELRREAMRRLETLLNDEVLFTTSTTKTTTTLTPASTTATPTPTLAAATSTTMTSTSTYYNEMNTKEKENAPQLPLLLPPPSPIIVFTSATKGEEIGDSSSAAAATTRTATTTVTTTTTTNQLLDGTRWKVSLSIGREPGTWMPSTWGKSGSRINVSFVINFTSSQLYERDDFLRGSYAGCKVLHVVNNQATLGPTIAEGAKIHPAKDGGWRIMKGEGPMGTDLLRFYIELEERIAHSGGEGDVDVPKGRVYCSCGCFPFVGGDGGEKNGSAREGFAKELNIIEDRIAELRTKRAEITNPFNFDGIKLSREIFRLSQQAETVKGKLMVASVREPDRRLLRFSKDGYVGLTKEGGVCIQVNKGPAIEYHILGRFSIASADKNSIN